MVLEVLILDFTLIMCEDTLLGMIKITTLTIAPQGTALMVKVVPEALILDLSPIVDEDALLRMIKITVRTKEEIKAEVIKR